MEKVWNPNTGEFLSSEQEKEKIPTGKMMLTGKGKKVLLLDDGNVFNPENGEVYAGSYFGELREIT